MITKEDILEAIMKLRQAGKKMPQADRVRLATDRIQEEQRVMAETVQLWYQLFIPKQVTKENWEAALNKALLKNEPNTQIITPGLMESCLKELEQERQARAEIRREQEKDVPFVDPELRLDILTAMQWGVKTLAERRGLVDNPIGDFIRSDEDVISQAVKLLGITEEEAWSRRVLLRCWYNDRVFSRRTGRRAKTSIGFRQDGRMVLCYE